jgi:hypothetical protein
MIIYNVTINVDDDIHDDWLKWMKEKHIPDVMSTGKFIDYKICKVLTRQEDEVGTTYAIQYTCNSINDYELYQKEDAPRLQEEHSIRYKNKFVAFRTLLELV